MIKIFKKINEWMKGTKTGRTIIVLFFPVWIIIIIPLIIILMPIVALILGVWKCIDYIRTGEWND